MDAIDAGIGVAAFTILVGVAAAAWAGRPSGGGMGFSDPLSRVYGEGRLAARTGSVTDNPYESPSDEWSAWNRGFRDHWKPMPNPFRPGTPIGSHTPRGE